MSSKPTSKKTAQHWLEHINLETTAQFNFLDEEDPNNLFQSDLGAVLHQRYSALNRHHSFAPGDLVTWKPGFRNKRIPAEGRPAIVLRVLPQPIFDQEHDSASPYFQEPLDLVLGVICEVEPYRGAWMIFHYDSRLLQPWTPEVAL